MTDALALSSPRFVGDPGLEAAFAGVRFLPFGDQASAVVKIQQALFDAGFPLPSGATGSVRHNTPHWEGAEHGSFQ
jgi:hypothetical protein